jgi:hypothetical protein
MAEVVVLWSISDGPYKDEILYEDSYIMHLVYCGQRNKRNNRDHLIPTARYFVGGKGQSRKYIGEIISVSETEKGPDTKKFVLTIKKEKFEKIFRLKKDFCNEYNLTSNDLMPGITKHSVV